MKSIRRAILARLVLGTALLLFFGTCAFTLGARALLSKQLDAALRAKVASLGSLFEQEGSRVEFNLVEAYMPEFDPGEAPEYFEVWMGERALVRSRSLGKEQDLPKRYGTEEQPLAFDLELPDGRHGRAVGAELLIRDYERSFLGNPGPAKLIVVVARERRELDAALLALLGGGALGSALLLGGVLLLGSRVADRGLRPVGDLVRHVERIADPTLASAYPMAGTPTELQPIAAGVNRLVERLASELQRERRTAANIAHELRTPVSELLVLSEVALRCADEPGHALEALRQVRDVSLQMRRLIGTLLELARLESGQTPLEPERIELAGLVRDCWQPLAEEARARGLSFELHGAEPAVEADRGALGILCANLLGNAVQHAPEGARVECVLSNGSVTSLTLSNPANGLALEDLDKLTEPFWRASAAREDRDHAGLGLALARRLAELLGVELTFALEQGWFRARLGFGDGGRAA